MQAGLSSNQGARTQPTGTQAPADGENVVAPMPSIPMYLAGLVVTYAGLHASNMALGDPSFSALIIGLTLIGFAASYITRRQNIAPRNIELPALVVCVCVVLMAVMTDPADSFLAPASVAEDRSKALALLLTWLTVFRSFTLTTDAALLFCCVPTIALIGLVGTSTTDPILPTLFVVFVTAAVFMMVHENVRQTALSHRERRRKTTRTAAGWSGQLQASAVCTILALLLANFATPYFQTAGSYVRVNSGLSSLRSVQERVQTNRTVNTDRAEIDVASGPVQLSDEIVFTVQSKEPANWRGATFDHYTGHSWQSFYVSSASTLPDMVPAEEDPRSPDRRLYKVPEGRFSPRARKYHDLDQHVHYVNGSTSTIYGAGEIRSVTLPQRRVQADDAGAVRLADPLMNAEYDIHSEVADLTPEDRKAPPGDYPQELDAFTSLNGMPQEARERVRQQALEVTKSITSAYGKVDALETWIGKECKYNTSTPAFPAGRDVVDYFLFESRQGYCDSFATSLAVMCRAIGIPARVVSGYLSGDNDGSGDLYVVRDRHKHLWTEVYFNNVGWAPFDATALATDVSPTQNRGHAHETSFWAALLSRGWWPIALIGVVAVLLLYVAKVELLDRYLRPRREGHVLGLPETNIAILHHYEDACRALARRNMARRASETASEYLARAADHFATYPEVTACLTELTEQVNACRYSRLVASQEDVEQSERRLASLSQALRGTPRRALPITSAAPETA